MDYQWETRTASEGRADTDALSYKNPRFHLHLVQETSKPSDRPVIHSTKFERLSYFRALTATASKTEIVLLSHVELNVFIWFYVLNVFFKTLPHSFVHFFMASYAPQEHVFLTKMVPLCYGFQQVQTKENWIETTGRIEWIPIKCSTICRKLCNYNSQGFKFLLVIAAFLEMATHSDTVLLLLHYAVDGIVRKNPWNRCLNATYYDEKLKVIMNCYNMEQFAEKAKNTTMYYEKYAYVTKDYEIFQMAQIEYYRLYATDFVIVRDLAYFIILWVSISFFHTRVVKRQFWKFLNACQWTINVVDMITFMFLLVNDEYNYTVPKKAIQRSARRSPSVFSVKFWINPSTDCAAMVISNALLYLFRALLSFKVKLYVEAVVHTEIHLVDFNQRSWFYFWPMFYSTFYLGNIFTLVFLILNGVTEFLVLSVTYHCLVETMTYEWAKLKAWMVTSALTVAGILMFVYTSIWTRALLFIYGKGMATLTESVFLYLLYPLGRLVDDYTFHYGSPPTKLRILSLRLVPIYYSFKWYFMMEAVWEVMQRTEFPTLVPHYLWSWSLMLIPLIVGVLYIMYQYLIVYGMTWQYMFRPKPKWGPKDFFERQLRKEYNSKYYISSEVPRLLSRYLILKRESKVYKVDVRYDMMQKRPTESKVVGFGEEKKIKIM